MATQETTPMLEPMTVTRMIGRPLGFHLTEIVGPNIDPCPWLTADEKRPFVKRGMTGLPYYLWDRQDECTDPHRTARRKRYYKLQSG